MARIKITHDDGKEATHDVPEIAATEIEAMLDLWAQFPKGISIAFEDGEETIVGAPFGF
jgi:hypothetical protein